MRSLLTSLGVIIGVGSVIIMVAIGEGSQRQIEASIGAMGTNLLQVSQRRQIFRGAQTTNARPARLYRTDASILAAEASYLQAVSGVAQRTTTVTGSAANASVQVMGVEPGYLTVRNWPLETGYFFEEEDLENRSSLAVLGQTTAASLFGDAGSALGSELRIGNRRFTVVGLLSKKGAGNMGNDQDDIIMVPLDTYLTRITSSKTINNIVMSVKDKSYMEAAQKEATAILKEAHGLASTADADFDILNSAEMIEMASSTSRTLTTLLAAIAGVSLLVGGIGIMNIMLVSVTERTREIGIRMAVGAKKRDILFQFLAESIILSLMGGLIGIGLAVLVCRILVFMSIPTAINPLVVALAAFFAAFVGVFFGYYPASKAASLYPIDALRYE
jgi:putative ABC transport system permease protein